MLGSSKRYLKLIGNPKDPSKVVLDGSQGTKVPRQNGVRVDGANQVTINGFTAKHYNGNGFFVVNVSGYELNHLNATLSGVYGIYAFNSIGGVMENSAGVLQQRLGLLHRPDAQADDARALDRAQRQVVRQRPRLLGHQHALRDDHEVAVVQQRHRASSPTRWTPRSTRRRRTTSSPTTTSSGTTSTTTRARRSSSRSRRPARRTRSASASCSSAAAAPRSATTASTATTSSGSAPSSRSCSSRPTRPTSSATRSTTTSSGSAGPTSTAASCSTTAAGRTTASGPTSASTTTTPADGSTFAPCPFTGANTFNAAAQSEAINWSVGDPDARGVLDQAPARGQARAHAAGALQEVRVLDRSRADRRRGPGRGAGRRRARPTRPASPRRSASRSSTTTTARAS